MTELSLYSYRLFKISAGLFCRFQNTDNLQIQRKKLLTRPTHVQVPLRYFLHPVSRTPDTSSQYKYQETTFVIRATMCDAILASQLEYSCSFMLQTIFFAIFCHRACGSNQVINQVVRTELIAQLTVVRTMQREQLMFGCRRFLN